MAEAGWTPFPLWDKRHPDGKETVVLTPKYKDLLNNNRINLITVVDPQTEFWSCLQVLHVIDRATRDRIKVSINTTK